MRGRNHHMTIAYKLQLPQTFFFTIFSRVNYLKTRTFLQCTHPLDALLEQAGDLALAQRVHQLARRVVRRNQLHAVDEAV